MNADWKPDRDAQERAEAWFNTKFFKKGGIGDKDWQPIVAAAKAWGMPDKVKWRDWLKNEWDSNRANAIRVLVTAKAIEVPGLNTQTVHGKTPVPEQLKDAMRALVAALKPGPRGVKMATEDDWRANWATLDRKTVDQLLDLALIYEPVAGYYSPVEG